MAYSTGISVVRAPTTAEVCLSVPSFAGEERLQKMDKIRRRLKELNAALISHYYVHEDLQYLAEDTGGFVGDSLEMAKFGSKSDADVLVIAGVRFMGRLPKFSALGKRW